MTGKIARLPTALRGLARDPTSSLVAVFTLAVGIGASTAMFAVLDAVVLKDLPLVDPARVVVLWGEFPQQQFAHLPIGLADAERFGAGSRSLEAVAAADYNGAWPWITDEGEGRTGSLRVGPVGGSFFSTLGVKPFVGRLIEPNDGVRGAPPVIVLSYRYWQARYGGDASIIGQIMRERIGGGSLAIVGIAPPGFSYPSKTDGWASLRYSRPSDSSISVDVVGRLKAGATVEDARAEFEGFLRTDLAKLGTEWSQVRAVAKTLPDAVAGELHRPLWILTGAVALVLAIAAANAAAILLLRGAAREQELAIRSALGADRIRLVAPFFREAVALAATASVLGVGIAFAAIRALPRMAPADLPRITDAVMDGRVLLSAVVVGTITALLAGLAPALWISARSPARGLVAARSVGGGSVSAVRWRRRLVIAQMALTVLTVTSAGLLLRSLARLSSVEMGFRDAQLLIGQIAAPIAKLDISDSTGRYFDLLDQLLERVGRVPGVLGVTAMVNQPFSGTAGMDGRLSAEGQSPEQTAKTPWLNMEVVGPNYFQVMGLELVTGRAFTPADRNGSIQVVIMSEAAAKGFWPGQDPIGKRIGFGGDWRAVVGVARDTRYRELVDRRPTIYFPYRQARFSPLTVLAFRVEAEGAELAPAIRSALRAVDQDVGIEGPTPVRTLTAAPLASPRFQTSLLLAFAMIAVLLAAVGIYGLVAAMVRLRTNEIGIRMALGATGLGVSNLIVGYGLRLALIGAGLGLLASLAVGRVLRSLLFEITTTDPVTITIAVVVVIGVGLAGTFFPAQAAARVDPMRSLRSE